MNWLLKKLIKRYKVISFDIFDTLIERNVDNPSDIFSLTGEKILGKDKAKRFCEDRIKAEKNAREFNCTLEVTIDEIYEQLDKNYLQFVEKLKQSEIELELEKCHAKKNMVSVFSYAVSLGKPIYLISDMYLPKTVIEHILNKCGIDGYSKLYVSNEYGKNKLTGMLFQMVISENKLEKKNVLHIGDSVKEDFIGAHKAGINSFLISRKNRLGRLLH